ncbi:MAG: helix-turn-helix domain-containing protein [Neisseriaceae bacterium]
MKAYKYRIYPNTEQKILIAKTFGCVRKVYNLMLEDRIKNYELEKNTGIKQKLPTPAQYKVQFPFLSEVDSLALANAQLNLIEPIRIFFEE